MAGESPLQTSRSITNTLHLVTRTLLSICMHGGMKRPGAQAPLSMAIGRPSDRNPKSACHGVPPLSACPLAPPPAHIRLVLPPNILCMRICRSLRAATTQAKQLEAREFLRKPAGSQERSSKNSAAPLKPDSHWSAALRPHGGRLLRGTRIDRYNRPHTPGIDSDLTSHASKNKVNVISSPSTEYRYVPSSSPHSLSWPGSSTRVIWLSDTT